MTDIGAPLSLSLSRMGETLISCDYFVRVWFMC